MLQQMRAVDEFVMEFQRIVVMTHHLLKERLIFIFIKGLMEPLRGMVKVTSPRSLDDTIRAAYDLEPIMKSLKGWQVSKGLII